MTNRFRGVGFVFAVMGTVACIALSWLEQPVPNAADLQRVTGRLTSKIVAVSPFKASPYASVEIQTAVGSFTRARIDYVCFLWTDCVIPSAIASLSPGDTVTLLLTDPSAFRGGNIYVWSLRQGQSDLLSFTDMSASNAAQRWRYLQLFGGVAAVGILFELSILIIGYAHKGNTRHP